tara:strand:+ start:289 stop:423 length:135 start_codon:yes stop_codon:yes gene_type:complete
LIAGEGSEKNKIKTMIDEKNLNNEITLVDSITNPISLFSSPKKV